MAWEREERLGEKTSAKDRQRHLSSDLRLKARVRF